MTAVSLADTIASYDTLDIGIKWPNDCLINGRKVAGILTELSAEVGKVHNVIVGIGININHRRQDFPADLAKTATSLRAELKQEVGRVEFLQRFLRHFEADYRLFRKSGLKALHKRILKFSVLIGKKIKLDQKGAHITGTAVDIDLDGNLVLDTAAGLRPFNAGEVTILKRN
jgi:BirA family biotin operon repressor/biotin-[acetyl-CoA-carboxylase] ligase